MNRTHASVRGWRACLMAGALAVVAAGCSSPALRYIAYRLSPDRVSVHGERTLEGAPVREPVTIVFDRFAIPHIRARNEHDATLALGYMHGRDRRFQLESMRLLAGGRLRELVGAQGSDGVLARLDVSGRLIGLYRDADALLAEAAPGEIALLEAYAKGVNLAAEREPVPMEFRILGAMPQPWTPRDSFLTLALVSFGLCKNWEHELGRLELAVHQLRTGSTIERALAIWKTRFDLPPHLFGAPLPDRPLARIPAVAPELAAFLGDHYAARQPVASRAFPVALASPPNPWDAFFRGGSSSNNWAMGGEWGGTGKGAMGSDPHMPHGLPALGYLAHVTCDPCDGRPFQAIGAGFMGLPGITFGTNGQVAWSATANWTDVTDLYVEQPVPGRDGFYATPNGPEAFQVREEIFRIRTGDDAYDTERRTVRVSRHGPLVNDFVERLPEDFPLVALQRQGLTGHPIRAMQDLYRAPDVAAARAALNGLVAFTGHWVLSDADGAVAYMPTARLPRRAGHLGTFPAPGWTGRHEWDGFVANADLPWLPNPPRAFVATANNQVVQPDAYVVPINFEGDVPNRFERITHVLGADGTAAALERTRALHLDGLDAGLEPLLRLYRAPLDRLARDADGNVALAARLLRDWNGDHAAGGAAASVWNVLVALLVEATLEDELSAETLEFVLTYFNIEPFVFSIIGDFSNPAWDDRRTPQSETAAAVFEATFRKAVRALEQRYGGAPDDWQWHRVAPFVLRHPFGGQRFLASYLNRPLQATGAGNTVNKQQFMRGELTSFPVKFGPVLRVNLDLADLAGSTMSLPGGESGRPSSEHYDDLLPLYMAGRGAPMEMDFDRIEAVGKLLLTKAGGE